METTKIVVTTEVLLPKDVGKWQVKDLEGQLLEAALLAGRKAYQEALVQYEKHFLKQYPELQRKERWPKQLATRLGSLRYERYRVWDAELKKSRYPLDEMLGMKTHERVSGDYKQAYVEQAVQHSYRQAAAVMQQQTSAMTSVLAGWRLVQSVASEQREIKTHDVILPWKQLLLPDAPRQGEVDPCPVLGIDPDDTYCRSWKTKKFVKDHQVRVAVLYRHKTKVSKKRWKLQDKTVVTSGPGESVEAFYNRVVQTAITHYGLHQDTLVVVHGDGDPSIRNFAKLYFGNALYRLDPWHVQKKIKEACGLKQVPSYWYEDIYGKPDELIGKIRQFATLLPREDPRKDKVRDLMQYLENNKAGLLPSGISTATKQKYPRLFKRGSGTIERNIAWTVNDRFKLPRMSWSLAGLENLLFLREKFLNTEVKATYTPKPGTKPEYFCLMH